ncbi:MAG: hypothetical protein N2449_02215 [Bacteroidales bacterium]|nr:hypothetical protein [Bacteroidales bacterium]
MRIFVVTSLLLFIIFDWQVLWSTDFTSYDFKPRRSKFKRQRLGSHTLMGEAGMFYGYYKGLRYSFNYDGILEAEENHALTLRLGIGYSQATNDSTVLGQEVFIPISIHVIIGKKNHFDLGLGGYYFENRKDITPMLFIGFRHQNPKGGFTYRIGADIHMERVYDLRGRNLQKTAVYGPLIALGWSF